MKAGPQQDQAPYSGALFVVISPQGSGSSLTLKVLKGLARLLGIPIAQPIPVQGGSGPGLTRKVQGSGSSLTRKVRQVVG